LLVWASIDASESSSGRCRFRSDILFWDCSLVAVHHRVESFLTENIISRLSAPAKDPHTCVLRTAPLAVLAYEGTKLTTCKIEAISHRGSILITGRYQILNKTKFLTEGRRLERVKSITSLPGCHDCYRNLPSLGDNHVIAISVRPRLIGERSRRQHLDHPTHPNDTTVIHNRRRLQIAIVVATVSAG
jgi:hypothetical protein